MEEKIMVFRDQPVRKPLIKISHQLVLHLSQSFDVLTLINGVEVPFTAVTEIIIYAEAIIISVLSPPVSRKSG